jgi:riboflavin-specific deaminase-like protein
LNHLTETPAKAEHLDLAWRLLLDKLGQVRISSSSVIGNSSSEITTSQLAKLFQESDEATRALIDLYRPLIDVGKRRFVVAHLGQSLDGRIAALNGASRWITGPEDVLHNHRMRALCDAVVVGASTVCYDDPKLTVRGIAGRSPVRVVIDPRRRLAADYKIFSDDEVETLLLCQAGAVVGGDRHGQARVIGVRGESGALMPEAIVEALEAEGLSRIFVEGGGMTISRFLEAGALDRLQITVAPVILGSGRPSISLPEIETVADGLRPAMRQFRLGDDTLFECCFERGH